MKIVKFKNHCTVGELLDFIEKYNIPKEGKILIQRIEDVYFEKHHWNTIDMPGHQYNMYKDIIDKAKSGEYNDKEKYPLMTQEDIDKYINSEKDLDMLKDS